MVVSDFSGPGYVTGYRCDECGGRSKEGHLDGSRDRWHCSKCDYDLCLQCFRPRNVAKEVDEKTEQLDDDLDEMLANFDDLMGEIEDNMNTLTPDGHPEESGLR